MSIDKSIILQCNIMPEEDRVAEKTIWISAGLEVSSAGNVHDAAPIPRAAHWRFTSLIAILRTLTRGSTYW